MLCLLGVLITFLIAVECDDSKPVHYQVRASPFETPRQFHFGPASDGDVKFPVLAEVYFSDTIQENGWSTLSVYTTAYYPDVEQAYWAGYLETYTSYNITKAYFDTYYSDFCKKPLSSDCVILQEYISGNLDFMINMTTNLANTEPYWNQIKLLLWQAKGIADAFEKRTVVSSDELTYDYLKELKNDIFGAYLLQQAGELDDLFEALNIFQETSKQDGFTIPKFRPTCSALIKVVEKKTNVFLSHVTWNHYKSMLRVLKQYDFPWRATEKSDYSRIASRSMSFSSYPSIFGSVDDFYVLKSKLVTLETTNSVYNKELYLHVKNEYKTSVPELFRVMVANRLANTAKEWAQIFSRYNSGTYNNQWMVFDAKLFEYGKELPDNDVLYIAEQIPGKIEIKDVSEVLKSQTYWASYNIPYIESIYEQSGYPDKVKEKGDWFDYNNTARAQMFRRDHSKVTNITEMCKLMAYNDFQHDSLSKCNCTPAYTAENAISARCDLNDPNGTYPISAFGYRLHGSTDFKVTDMVEHLSNLTFVARSGPTYDQQPPFDWTKLPVPFPKPALHPDRWKFPPIVTSFEKGIYSNN